MKKDRYFSDRKGFDTNADCFKNGLVASLDVLQSDINETTRIYKVATSKGPHSYLVIGAKAYNTGVTAQSTFYPDLSVSEIEEHGVDLTEEILSSVLGLTEDKQGYRKYVRAQRGDFGIALSNNLFHRIRKS